MSKRRHLFCLAVLATASVALASCSDSSGGKAVTVTGSDDGCEIEQTTLPAGKLDFVFTNTADDVNELYVLKADTPPADVANVNWRAATRRPRRPEPAAPSPSKPPTSPTPTSTSPGSPRARRSASR